MTSPELPLIEPVKHRKYLRAAVLVAAGLVTSISVGSAYALHDQRRMLESSDAYVANEQRCQNLTQLAGHYFATAEVSVTAVEPGLLDYDDAARSANMLIWANGCGNQEKINGYISSVSCLSNPVGVNNGREYDFVCLAQLQPDTEASDVKLPVTQG
ncbi:MAG TPA: hypothetical protein VF575_01520 [Candidatus Saccharimonadales bacterium]